MLCVMGMPTVFFHEFEDETRRPKIAMWAAAHLLITLLLVLDGRFNWLWCQRGSRRGWYWPVFLAVWIVGNTILFHRAQLGEQLGCTHEAAAVSMGVLATPWLLTVATRLPYLWARQLDVVMVLFFVLDSYVHVGFADDVTVVACLSNPASFLLLYATNVAVVTVVEYDDVREFLRMVALEAKAHAAVESRDAFLRYMFHEVRVPLNAVTVGLEVLERDVLDGIERTGADGGALAVAEKRQLSTVQALKKQSESAVRILSTTLALESLEKGMMTLRPSVFRLTDLVGGTVDSFAHVAEEHNIVLESAVDPLLPECVIGDMTRLQQVLGNLVSNALKFTKAQGRVTLTALVAPEGEATGITVPKGVVDAARRRLGSGRLYADEDSVEEIPLVADDSYHGPTVDVRFAVRDSGIGMAPAELARLFQPFTQFDRGVKQQRGHGTGLGLSFARALVELHGGSIFARSEERRGSEFVFVVRLPAAPPSHQVSSLDEVEVRGTTPSSSDGGSASRPRAKRVLVVDDSDVGRRMLMRMLPQVPLRAGFDIESHGVGDGSDAVQLIQDDEQFDLILMDISMPGMDGVEATKRIQAIRPSVPIVGLSGNTLAQDVDELLAAGAVGFLSKPLTKNALARELRRLGWPVAGAAGARRELAGGLLR